MVVIAKVLGPKKRKLKPEMRPLNAVNGLGNQNNGISGRSTTLMGLKTDMERDGMWSEIDSVGMSIWVGWCVHEAAEFEI